MKPLIIYHDDMDGFVAALCYYLVLGDSAEYRAVNYGEPPPADAVDRPVAVLDFSYDRETTEALWTATGQQLFILDHHVSAAENLKELPYCQIDTRKSGAKLAFEHLFNDLKSMAELQKGGITHPLIFRLEAIVNAVDDCDRCAHLNPQSKPIYSALHSYAFDFALWYETVLHHDSLVADGLVIGRYRAQQVKRMVRYARTGKVWYGAENVPGKIVNTSVFQSDVGAALVDANTIAVLWYQMPDGRYRYSFRSAPNGPDVHTMVKHWWGGGHAHAAGFVSGLKPDEFIDFDKVQNVTRF